MVAESVFDIISNSSDLSTKEAIEAVRSELSSLGAPMKLRQPLSFLEILYYFESKGVSHSGIHPLKWNTWLQSPLHVFRRIEAGGKPEEWIANVDVVKLILEKFPDFEVPVSIRNWLGVGFDLLKRFAIAMQVDNLRLNVPIDHWRSRVNKKCFRRPIWPLEVAEYDDVIIAYFIEFVRKDIRSIEDFHLGDAIVNVELLYAAYRSRDVLEIEELACNSRAEIRREAVSNVLCPQEVILRAAFSDISKMVRDAAASRLSLIDKFLDYLESLSPVKGNVNNVELNNRSDAIVQKWLTASERNPEQILLLLDSNRLSDMYRELALNTLFSYWKWPFVFK